MTLNLGGDSVSKRQASNTPGKCAYCEIERDDHLLCCTSCSMSVHQTCYGADHLRGHELSRWRCEPCLRGVAKPRCRLCPVEQGVFKECADGRWVHLRCALYIPPIKFNDVSRLASATGRIQSPIVPERRWTARHPSSLVLQCGYPASLVLQCGYPSSLVLQCRYPSSLVLQCRHPSSLVVYSAGIVPV